jgi:carboxypeptidase C (cathepsin A)
VQKTIVSWALVAGLAGLLPAAAQPRQRPMETMDAPKESAGQTKEAPPKHTPPMPEEKLVTTRHSARIGGAEVRYTATTGTLLLKEEDGTPKASIFFVAYSRDGVQDLGKRPITFTFNGGPGSSSVWLHMGAFGPRRVVMDDEGLRATPPYGLADNESSLLDVSDLVFIDPVTTGFSRAVPGQSDKQFHGVQEDVESVGEFIRLYCGRFGRWASPKFLAGESYGTTRAAGLSNYLQQRHGMYFNGILLISSILNFQTARFDVGNDLPYPLFLPTYTATAWYHQKLPADLQSDLKKALAEAEDFALEDYTLALARGTDLLEDERRATAEKLSRLTGLSTEYLQQVNLRPEIQAFIKELLRDRRETAGRLDSRFKGVDREAAGQESEFDPSYAAIQGPYTAMLNHYVREELDFHSDLPYEILTGRVRPWSYGENENRYLNVAEDLRRAMTQNPALLVFVANGYYDLATPYFATEYTFDHLGFDATYGARVTKTYYEAGHMMYIRKADREKLKRDVVEFLREAMGEAEREEGGRR